MRYKKIKEAVFLSRPNRFIAYVELEGKKETVHVKNTGRCKELLVPGCTCYLSESDNPERKTKYDLVAVIKETDNGPVLINMDSQIANDTAEEWLRKGTLFSKDAVIKRETKYGNSRFDFYIEDGERKIFLEVKGCTLEEDGDAMFPDAPTKRGLKHINELISCMEDGYEAYILIVIQMKGCKRFFPAFGIDDEFSEGMFNAERKGVKVLAYDCVVTPDSIEIDKPVYTDIEGAAESWHNYLDRLSMPTATRKLTDEELEELRRQGKI